MTAAGRQTQQNVSEQMRAAYQMGRAPRWQLIFNQQEPERVSRLLHYHDIFIGQQQRQYQAYQEQVENLASLESKVQASVSQLHRKQKKLQQQRDRLVMQRKDRKRTLSRLRGLIKNKDQQLKQEQKQQAELEQVIAAASRIAAGVGFKKNHQSFKKRQGKLQWPLKGRIQNRFGAARNGSLRWDGVLLKASIGTAVAAIHGGRVLFADWLPGQGLLLIVDHGGGYMSLYAHNEVLLKEPGEWVESGDTIARSGNSGGQQTAGLYFEIRHQGKPSNPTKWCKRG